MKFDWAIWKSSADSSEVRFLHESDLPAAGLASVYRFTEVDAKAMQTLGSYKNFKGTVYSGQLKIDADTAEASEACEGRLKALGLAYSKFSTGNRGHHYHVVRSCAPSHTLPTGDKLFVKENFPACDMSFYHHVGLYRQEGALHQKTGGYKQLLYSVEGKALETVSAPHVDSGISAQANDGRVVSVFEDQVLRLMTVPADHGERHRRYVDLALRLDTLNQAPEFAVGYIYNVDLMSGGALPMEDIVRIVEWAYYKRAK
jgi:hypothetical protein